MHLKNLTVLGFKSFADKTSLDFQPGVTAIVGPNGCGKSNVSDAIRWVLGEQSAKALRGGEMADVIFNGTDRRKQLGMAEVSLTIDDVDQDQLSAAGVSIDYNEVTITRRVFRDGGSEYFINKSPCRLKDIQQFFMGTGVGRSSYSIMAQGNITQILSSKPEDRRMIFEEAAGITKFKAQKREALRKLDYTEQNLLRVSDLIREVKRQIGSLQRQAGKARRYKTLALELETLETQLARHQFDVLQGEIGDRIQTNDRLRQEIEDSSGSLITIEDEIRQLRERLTTLEHEIGQSQQAGMELKAKAEHHESRIHFNSERLGELDRQTEKAHEEIAEAEQRATTAQAELNQVTQQLSESEEMLQQQQQQLEEKQQAVRDVEAQLSDKQEELRQAQSDSFAATQSLSTTRAEINALDLQKQGNIARLEKLSSEKIQLEEERTRLDARLNTFAATVEEKQLNAQTHRGTVAQREERLKEIQVELAVATEELDELLRYQAELRSRLAVLMQLQTSHEGFSEGTLSALKQTEDVLGSLADRISVPDRYVAAIEAALGHHLQLVLTKEPAQAQRILAELRNGRASIAPLELDVSPSSADTGSTNTIPLPGTQPAPSSNTPFPVPNDAAEVQPSALPPETLENVLHAITVVKADDDVLPLIQRLLGLARIVPNLQIATAHWQETRGAFDYVTESGEILTRHGVYTGGSADSGDAPSSILGRKNQIADLESDLEGLHSRIEDKSRSKGALVSERTELEASLEEAETELREHEVEIATQQGEVRALENSQRALHQKIDTVVYEIQCLANQENEGKEKHDALTAEVARLEQRDQETTDLVAHLTEELESIRENREQAGQTLSESRVQVAGQQQINAGLKQQQQPLQQRITETTQVAEQRRHDIGLFAERKGLWEAELEESRHKIIELNQEREQINTRTNELIAQKRGLEENVSTREEDLRHHRQKLTSLQEKRSTIDVELAQKNMAVDNIREKIQQKYQKNIDDVRSEAITITYADEGQTTVETVSPEEMAESGATTDWDAVEAQVAAMQKKLDDMGPVNLVAIEEYEETEQRHQFLSGQHDDLVKAKDQLHEVINRINVQTREMFIATFQKIRENFQTLFQEIFGGGKADLVLADEQNVLESGIDIVARPPGKKLQGISLLSGGEQTMTAVSLLFGIYQVKPSPFCVLDELDAPLDESNIVRFIKVLQRFLSHSQFIIITHNKRTISIADVLYGVTMQEHGVSKIVSVKFHKADEPEPKDHGKPLDQRLIEESASEEEAETESKEDSSDEESQEDSSDDASKEVVMAK